MAVAAEIDVHLKGIIDVDSSYFGGEYCSWCWGGLLPMVGNA